MACGEALSYTLYSPSRPPEHALQSAAFPCPLRVAPSSPLLPRNTFAVAGGVSVQYLTDSHMPSPPPPSAARRPSGSLHAV